MSSNEGSQEPIQYVPGVSGSSASGQGHSPTMNDAHQILKAKNDILSIKIIGGSNTTTYEQNQEAMQLQQQQVYPPGTPDMFTPDV